MQNIRGRGCLSRLHWLSICGCLSLATHWTEPEYYCRIMQLSKVPIEQARWAAEDASDLGTKRAFDRVFPCKTAPIILSSNKQK